MKSNIKSKKQKMAEKKFSKGNTPHLIDLVQSSSSESVLEVEKIEKKSKHSGKSFNGNNTITQNKFQPNILNIDRLKKSIIQNKNLAQNTFTQHLTTFNSKQSLKSQNKDNENLLVVQASLTQQQGVQDRSLFSYKVEGKQGIKYISESHFKGRINSEIRELELKTLRKAQQQEQELERIMNGDYPSSEQSAELKNEQKQQKKEERKRAARYYEEELSDEDDEEMLKIVKCFRCNKKGHIAKNCIEEEPKIQCNFCLGEHHHSVCDSSPCFKCCQPGHISQDCNSKAIQCNKCRKRGHRSENCGIFIFLDYHNRNDEDIKRRFKVSDLKALKCSSFCKKPSGHFNCFNYNNNKGPHPYTEQVQNRSNYRDYYNQQYNQRQNYYQRR